MGSHTGFSLPKKNGKLRYSSAHARTQTQRKREMHAHSNTIQNNPYKYIQMRDSKKSKRAGRRVGGQAREPERISRRQRMSVVAKKRKPTQKSSCSDVNIHHSFVDWWLCHPRCSFIYLLIPLKSLRCSSIHTHSHTLATLVLSQKACCSRSTSQ